MLQTILSIPPPPPVSPKLFSTDIDPDTIIQSQFSMIFDQLKGIEESLEMIENNFPHVSHQKQQFLKTTLKILIALPPPFLPMIPEPTNRTRKKLRSLHPSTGRGGAIVRRPKTKRVRKNVFSEMINTPSLFLSQTGLDNVHESSLPEQDLH